MSKDQQSEEFKKEFEEFKKEFEEFKKEFEFMSKFMLLLAYIRVLDEKENKEEEGVQE